MGNLKCYTCFCVFQSLSPAMCSQGRTCGDNDCRKGWEEHGQASLKTWSQRRAEHLARKASPSPKDTLLLTESPIEVSSADSEAEDSDTLPDLEDFLPDLEPSPVPGFSVSSISPRKPFSMGSPHRKHERHFLDSFSHAPLYQKKKGNTSWREVFDTKPEGKPALKRQKVEDDTGSLEEFNIDSQSRYLACKHKKMCEDTDLLEDFDIKIKPCKEETCEHLTSSEKTNTKAGLMKRRRDRISQEMQAGSVPIHTAEYSVFAFPHNTSSKASAERRASRETELCSGMRRLRKEKFRVKFLLDLTTFPPVERLCGNFAKLQVATLDDLLDDCDPSNFSNCLDLLEDFCSKRKPPSMLIEKVIKNGFFSQMDKKISVHCQHVLFTVWQMYPDTISSESLDIHSVLLAGDVLQKYLQNADLSSKTGLSATGSRGGTGSRLPSFYQARLYFQLFVKGLQLNLNQCKLADQKSVNRSLAFACLSSDRSHVLVKQLTHWLDFCLVVRQPEHMAVAEQWMCQLQTVLELSVLVSRDRHEAAKQLAPALKRTYRYLTDLCTKKQLLRSFSCPLLCFYVLRLVMEDQCESTIVSSQFPPSIHDVIHNYFLALPPQDHMTPPPSPSGDEDLVGHENLQMYSVQSCEELAMLVYFISKSFIACKQSKLHFAVVHFLLRLICVL